MAQDMDVKFNTSEDWIINAIELMKRVEHVQKGIVELSRQANEIITWVEFINDAVGEMKKQAPTFEIVKKEDLK
jgi:hypothetical protein